MFGIDEKVLNRPPKKANLDSWPVNCEKSAAKHSVEDPMLLNWMDLFTTFFPRLIQHATYGKPTENRIMHQRFLWYSKISIKSHPHNFTKSINPSIFLILHLFNPFQVNVPFLYPVKTGYRKRTLAWNRLITIPSIKFKVELSGHWLIIYASSVGPPCRGRGRKFTNLHGEGGACLPAYTLDTHLLFLRNWDVLTQFKFIATIHEVNNFMRLTM